MNYKQDYRKAKAYDKFERERKKNQVGTKKIFPKKWVWMESKYNSECHRCTGRIRIGKPIYWRIQDKKVFCSRCKPETYDREFLTIIKTTKYPVGHDG